jgi:hypothetical protein
MSNPTRRSNPENETEGIDMASLCHTVVRVLALLDEDEYTVNTQQDTVLEHDALPDPASASDTREAS